MQCFWVDPKSRRLNLETHQLALTIMKKTLYQNCFKNAHKTMDRKTPSFQLGCKVYFKNKQPGKWGLKWRSGHRIGSIECKRHYLHIENQATGKTKSCNIRNVLHEPPLEFWNIDTQFGRARMYINHPITLPTIMLWDWRWTLTTCK